LPNLTGKTDTWTLLLVKESGKTIQVKQPRLLGIVCIALFLAVLSAAGGFYLLYDRTARENNKLRQLLADSETMPETVQEKTLPLLMPEKTVVREKAESPAASTTDRPAPESKRTSPVLLPVTIEDFESAYDKNLKILTLQFKLRNTSPEGQPVAGYVAALLKGRSNEQVALPEETGIKNGQPDNFEAGLRFSISNYKNLKLQLKDETHPERFRSAVIFIAGEDGEPPAQSEYSLTTE